MGKYDGQAFGSFTVISSNKAGVLVQCDCGSAIRKSTMRYLKDGQIKGCMECRHLRPRKVNLEGHGGNQLYQTYKFSANKRGYDFEIGWEDFLRLIQEPCHYCGTVGSNTKLVSRQKIPFCYNGLDRVNNSEGYTLDNVVTACHFCNLAKRERTSEEFYSWLRLIGARYGPQG